VRWLLLFVALPAFAVSPTLVHFRGSENSRGTNGFSHNTVMQISNVDPVISGNCFGVAFAYQYNNATMTATPTVTDDKSDTFYQIPQNPYDSGVRKAQAWMTPPITTGPSVISLSWPGSGGAGGTQQIHAITFELTNCGGATSGAISDGSNSAVVTGTSIAAGSFSPGTAGDLLMQFAWDDSAPNAVPAYSSAATLGSNTGITWLPMADEMLDGMVAQYGTYSLTSAINPTITVPSSSTVITIAFAVKGGATGGVPSGNYIFSEQHVSLWATAQSGPGYSVPSVTQFPAQGNAMVVAATGDCDITSIVYGSTTMTKRLTYVGTGANETQQFFTLENYTPNNSNLITITPNTGCTGTGAGATWTLVFQDVMGANTSPFDTTATASGNQTTCTGSCSISGPSITPGNSTGIIFTITSEFFNEVSGVSSPFVLDTIYGTTLYQLVPIDQQNGTAHYYNTSTAAQTPTWSYLAASTNLGNWAAASMTFKAASAPSSPGTYMMIGQEKP
jgi:hypothetical protein